ncbi:hypothetical protein MNEG_6939 [Monoraphidium neglectum]|uniref:Uncharacterized protein n=1 Tax=Monoraphidium neglectum TaxID=145388 RepID=A0A0D2L0W1_9CHLO|nr:hypothetical protein MNEG_6939 [Monoraphidium neglectum]KIZ01024.1 hypothetical protein MNEG_6939 [Monoraphidium neglectum]|eukprot:XP_013900043.1 hypothetical protein MNEG_6939 [Monoraphidium neglectum]
MTPPGVIQVQAALQGAFPACDDLSSDPARGITAFSPHLSLGQWRGAAAAEAAAGRLAAAWPAGGVSFTVDEVFLISRRGFDSPFAFRWAVPLGGAGPQRRVDAPYVASMGRAPPALLEAGGDGLRKFGLGASAAGAVWTFAFGANMAPSKLAARRAAPLESRPARLRARRLVFDHRGGFGNLVPPDDPAAAALVAAAAGSAAPGDVHGVLHRLAPEGFAALCNAEHEYWPLEEEVGGWLAGVSCMRACGAPSQGFGAARGEGALLADEI